MGGGIGRAGAVHLHTLEPPVRVDTQLVLGAVVVATLTLVNVLAAALVSGQLVARGTHTLEAARRVHTGVNTQTTWLAQREHFTLVNVCAHIVVPA